MSFPEEPEMDRPNGAASPPASGTGLPPEGLHSVLGHAPLSELEWLAFRYLADELEASETAAFEQLLLESAAAGEAMVAMVSLLEQIGRGQLGGKEFGAIDVSGLAAMSLPVSPAEMVSLPLGEEGNQLGDGTPARPGSETGESRSGGARRWPWLAVAAAVSGLALFGWWQRGSDSGWGSASGPGGKGDLAAESVDSLGVDSLGWATEWAAIWAEDVELADWEELAGSDGVPSVEVSGAGETKPALEQAAVLDGPELTAEGPSEENDWLFTALVSLEELEDWPAKVGEDGGGEDGT